MENKLKITGFFIFHVLDESYPALKIEVCAPVAMHRFAGKPRNRAPTDIFERIVGFVLSARKMDLNTQERENLEEKQAQDSFFHKQWL